MNIRNIKRFFGIFVLAFLIVFIVVIIRLPQNDDKNIIVTDNDLLIPDPDTATDPGSEVVIEPETIPEVVTEPEPQRLEPISLVDEEMPASLLPIAKQYNVIGMSIAVIENGEVTHSYVFGDQQKATDTSEAIPYTDPFEPNVAKVVITANTMVGTANNWNSLV